MWHSAQTNYFRIKQVLVCTDVAGMGIDIQDLDFAINLGKSSHNLYCLHSYIANLRYSQELLEA